LEETLLDRDIRALYRTGLFQTIEMKYERVDAGAMRVIVELTAKRAPLGVQFEGVERGPGSASATATNYPAAVMEETLAEARKQSAAANAELASMREERAVTLTKRELEEARQKRDLAQERLRNLHAQREVLEEKRRAEEVAERERGPSAKDELRPRTTPVAASLSVNVQPLPALNGAAVYEGPAVDRQPKPKFQARPRYPFEMRRRGIAGEVVVDLIVDDKGDVINARVASSSREEFEAAAVQAISKWKYFPGQKNGRNVHTHLQVPIIFTVNE
jgi:TonB family protein